MKRDLDDLMEQAELDALLVVGPTTHNPAMAYFTGTVFLTHGDLLKKRHKPSVLFHFPMERDEAARTGLRTQQLDGEFNWLRLLEEAGGDELRTLVLLYQQMLAAHDVSGRVGLYGNVELGPFLEVFRRLETMVPGLEFVGELERKSVLAKARRTKSDGEVERIRKMGEVTVAVVGEVADFLTTHRAKQGVLVNKSGEVLTIGQVKRRINLWLAERGVENPKGTIFAIGRDAGVPHSIGQDSDPVELGKPIIFDIFPCEAGGGYYYDFTRTWCLGYASDEALQLYEDVASVYEEVLPTFQANAPCRDSQVQACQLFSAQGHSTILENPDSQEGYVHGLGHGLGLAVHEAPSFAHPESNDDLLLPGTVFTFEPGLYYPERGLGVRIEDTLWMRADGQVEALASFPKDLVLQMK